MALKDYFSNSLESKLARHLVSMRDGLFFPEVVWGIVKLFRTEKGNYYRGIVKAGTRTSLDPDHEIWKTTKSYNGNQVEKELYEAMVAAAERFNLTFHIMEEDPEHSWCYRAKETIKTNWMTETNLP